MDTSSGQSSGSSTGLTEAEALLTGESVAVDKLWTSGEDAPSVFSGSLMVLGSLLALDYTQRQFGIAQDEVRAASFVAMMLGSLLLVWLNLKSRGGNGRVHRKPSRGFLLAVFGTGLTLLLINTVPVLQGLFKFATLSPTVLGLTFASGLLSYVLVLLVRRCKIFKAT